MSAFLGPIHHWLYNKIRLQDQLTQEMLQFADKEGLTNVRESVDSTYGKMPEGNLEDLIDENNIHGWLQGKITLVENRFAAVVTAILAQKPEAKEAMGLLAYDFGQSHSALTGENNAKDAYQLLNDSLIDGMPCDHVNMLISAEDDRVEWKRTQCVHAPYWTANEGDINVYYELRNQLVAGMLAASGLKLIADAEGNYVISK